MTPADRIRALAAALAEIRGFLEDVEAELAAIAAGDDDPQAPQADARPEDVVTLVSRDARGHQKHAFFLHLLERCSVMVLLDATLPGVVVPPPHSSDPRLVLRVGLAAELNIPDLSSDDEGFSATLSFRGVPERCRVPWAAVLAMTGEDARPAPAPGPGPTPTGRHLHSVPLSGDPAPITPPTGRLRLVPDPDDDGPGAA